MALELKSNVRKMRTDAYNKRSSLYLELRMHILRVWREFCLPNCKGEVVWRSRRKEAANPVSADP